MLILLNLIGIINATEPLFVTIIIKLKCMKSLVLILFIALPMFAFSQPNVNAIEPIQGDIGSTVSILGTGFSSVILENSVYFGNIQAEILSSSENQIQAIVPYGSTNSKITVYTNGLMSSSNIRFNC